VDNILGARSAIKIAKTTFSSNVVFLFNKWVVVVDEKDEDHSLGKATPCPRFACTPVVG
jgi:hypothetical protein